MSEDANNNDIEVREVASRSQLKTFIKLPWRIYQNNPYWVPPLIVDRLAFFDKKKNPFYRFAQTTLLIAYRNGKPVGRIATCVNRSHNEFHQEKVGFFGFFESIKDYDVAHRLLKVAMIYLKKAGMESMRGPCNFSTNHEVGLLIDNFEHSPQVMMTYNPPYYAEYFEKFGLKKVKDLLAFNMTQENVPSERLNKIVERIRQRSGATFRKINVRDFDNEILRVIEVYNQAWENNWGFVPLSQDEFIHIAKDMKMILDPDLALFAQIDGKPAGFALALPDVNQVIKKVKNGRLFPFGIFRLLWDLKVRKKINQARVLTMGIVKEFRGRGLDTVFYYDLYHNGVANGYFTGELSWILEDNRLMIAAAEALGAKPYKTYRIYQLPLMLHDSVIHDRTHNS